MRQLKFRTWDKLAKRFTYPDKGYQGHYVLDLNGKFQNLQNGSGEDEYIVQQFTGLIDSKGKDIYEGDIVKATDEEVFNNNFVGEVMFDEGSFCIHVEKNDTRGIWGGDDIEVIGNIFENKQLL